MSNEYSNQYDLKKTSTGVRFEVIASSPANQLTAELIETEARQRSITPGEYVLRVMKKKLVYDEDEPFE